MQNSRTRATSERGQRRPAPPAVPRVPVYNRITVVASYPGPGRLNIAFNPPIQTWRFPAHPRENDGRTAALDACRDAVRRQSPDGADAPTGQIEKAVEAALALLVENGSIALP